MAANTFNKYKKIMVQSFNGTKLQTQCIENTKQKVGELTDYDFYMCSIDGIAYKCEKIDKDKYANSVVDYIGVPSYIVEVNIFQIESSHKKKGDVEQREKYRTVLKVDTAQIQIDDSYTKWKSFVDGCAYFVAYNDISTTMDRRVDIAAQIIDIKEHGIDKIVNSFREEYNENKEFYDGVEGADALVELIEKFDTEYLKIKNNSFMQLHAPKSEKYMIDEKFRYLYHGRYGDNLHGLEPNEVDLFKKIVSNQKNIYDLKKEKNIHNEGDKKNLVEVIEDSYKHLSQKDYKHPQIPNNIYMDANYQLFEKEQFQQEIVGPMTKLYKEQYNHNFSNSWIIPDEFKFSNFEEVISRGDPVFVQVVDIKQHPEGKIVIIGDIHSSFHSLWEILDRLMNVEKIFESDKMILKKHNYIFFLGDMIDRGPYGVEVLYFVFKLKLLNFDSVFIINGNHEDKTTYEDFGFGYEMEQQFNDANYTKFVDVFLKYLPSAIYLKNDFGQIFHMSHGAFDMRFAGFNESNETYNPNNNLQKLLKSDKFKFALVDFEDGNNFKWGDKVGTLKKKDGTNGWYEPSHRGQGIGYFYFRLIDVYTTKHNIESVFTGHQDYINFGIIPSSGAMDDERMSLAARLNSSKLQESSTYRGKKIYGIDGTGGLKNEQIKLKASSPGRPFMALITSTATISRNISNCYCVLREMRFNEISDVIRTR